MEINMVTIGSDGLVRDSGGNVVTCSWTAMCEEDATALQQHPILGGVPICPKHQIWVEANSCGG